MAKQQNKPLIAGNTQVDVRDAAVAAQYMRELGVHPVSFSMVLRESVRMVAGFGQKLNDIPYPSIQEAMEILGSIKPQSKVTEQMLARALVKEETRELIKNRVEKAKCDSSK